MSDPLLKQVSAFKSRDARIAKLEQEIAEARARLDYVHSMGLRFGMMKSSDKPEPYLVHTWTEGSDNSRMFREWCDGIGHPNYIEVLAESARLRKALARADYFIGVGISRGPANEEWLSLKEEIKQLGCEWGASLVSAEKGDTRGN